MRRVPNVRGASHDATTTESRTLSSYTVRALGEGSRVVACCDLNADTLQKNRERYGQDIYTTSDYRELLARDLNAVFVCAPDFLHEVNAVAALNAGRAVYLKKPMAITTAGCDAILQAARASGSRLYVGHNMRHMPFVLEMKRLIDAGTIGNVKAIWCRHFVRHGGEYYFKDWHAQRRYSTGMLLQKGAHDIDITQWLAGGYSARVQGMGGLTFYGDLKDRQALTDQPRPAAHGVHLDDSLAWPPASHSGLNAVIDIEDVSMMQMRLDNGVLASYQQCHYTPDYWRSYCVLGDAGRLENFGDGMEDTTIKVWNRRKAGYAEPDEVHFVPSIKSGHGGADPRIVAEFLRLVREGGPTHTSPVAARYSVAAGCAATDSLRNGGDAVEVSPLDAETRAFFD